MSQQRGRPRDSNVNRRNVLKKAGAAVSGGIVATGVASASGKGRPKKPGGCPKCDEGKGGPTRFLIAHHPPGNPDKCIELCLPEPAARAHLRNHPDSCGPCEPDDGNKCRKKHNKCKERCKKKCKKGSKKYKKCKKRCKKKYKKCKKRGKKGGRGKKGRGND